MAEEAQPVHHQSLNASTNGGQILNAKKQYVRRTSPRAPPPSLLPSPKRQAKVEARMMMKGDEAEEKAKAAKEEVEHSHVHRKEVPEAEADYEEDDVVSPFSLLCWGGLIFLAGIAFWIMLSHIFWEAPAEVLEELAEEASSLLP